MVDFERIFDAAKNMYTEIAQGPYALPSLMLGLIGVALVAITVSHLGSDDHGHPH